MANVQGESQRAGVTADFDAVIIGAGFGGIGLGIKLRRAGLTDFIILEKSGRAGGNSRRGRA